MWSSSTHRQDIIINIVWQFTDDRKTYRWKNSFQSRLIYFIYNPENDSSSSSFHEKLFHSFLSRNSLYEFSLAPNSPSYIPLDITHKKINILFAFLIVCLQSESKFICRRWCKRHAQFNNLHEKWHTDINPLMRSAREKRIAQWGSW